MKKLLVISIVMAVVLTGCGGESDGANKEIENTIRGYVTTFDAGDFAGCLTYFTGYGDEEEARAFLSYMRSLSGELELRKVKDISIVGPDMAIATVVFTLAGEEGTDQMQLRKVDGQWKIEWVGETPGPTPTQAPVQYPPIRTEGCLPSTVEVAPELQGIVQVRHCLWSEGEGELWEAFQVLNIGSQMVDFTVDLYVYNAEGQELLLESLSAGDVQPGTCLGYCDADSRGAVPSTTTSYRIVVSPL